MSQQSVYAIARSEEQALQIEVCLTRAGFSNAEISALIPDRDSTLESAQLHAPEETMSGAATGGVLGGALGLLAGIGALVIPGVGRLIAVGPLLTALSGVVSGAAVVGISAALAGLGIPMTNAKLYENHITEGNILISVVTASAEEIRIAKEVLQNAMAEDIAITPTVHVAASV